MLFFRALNSLKKDFNHSFYLFLIFITTGNLVVSFGEVIVIALFANLVSNLAKLNRAVIFNNFLGDIINHAIEFLSLPMLIILLWILVNIGKIFLYRFTFDIIAADVAYKSTLCFENLISSRENVINKPKSSNVISQYTFMQLLQFGVYMPVLTIISSMLSSIIILIFYFYSTKLFGLIILISVSIPYIISLVFVRINTLALSEKIKISTISMNSLIGESLSTLSEIWLYRISNIFVNKFRKSDLKLRRSAAESTFLQLIPKQTLDLTLILSFTIFISYKYAFKIDDALILSLLILSVGLLQRLQPYITTLTGNYILLRGNKFALDAVEEMRKRNEKTYKKIPLSNDNEFEVKTPKFNFSYSRNSKKIFHSTEIEIKKNTITSIIGKSGQGKSTLISILMGLLPVELESSLLKKKNDLKEEVLFSSHISNLIAYLPQETAIIEGTLAENIRFFSGSKVNFTKLKKAINLSGLQLKDIGEGLSLNSRLRHNDTRFSGGQLQRLGIARSIYRGAKLLILDEPTSAIDPKTESKILNSLLQLKNECTIVIITHKKAPMNISDQIYNLEKGKIKKI